MYPPSSRLPDIVDVVRALVSAMGGRACRILREGEKLPKNCHVPSRNILLLS